MGWSFQGSCYAHQADLLNAVRSSFPVCYSGFDGASYCASNPVDFVVDLPVSGDGVLQYALSFQVRNWVVVPVYQRVSVPACDSGSSNAGASAVDPRLGELQLTVAKLQSALADTQSGVQKVLSAQEEPFDPALGLGVFSFFFSGVVLLWSVAKGGGAVLSVIRGRFR